MKWTGCEPRDVRDEINENLNEYKEREERVPVLAVCCVLLLSTMMIHIQVQVTIPIRDYQTYSRWIPEISPTVFFDYWAHPQPNRMIIRILYWTLTPETKQFLTRGQCNVESTKRVMRNKMNGSALLLMLMLSFKQRRTQLGIWWWLLGWFDRECYASGWIMESFSVIRWTNDIPSHNHHRGSKLNTASWSLFSHSLSWHLNYWSTWL